MSQQSLVLKDTSANPAPLGLLGFGMTTLLLNLHNAGFYSINSMIIAMGLFYGGLAQILVGLMEWTKHYTFGTTAFISYGLFWLTLVGILTLPRISTSAGTPVASPTEPPALVAYFVVWGVFTAFLFVGTLKMNRALQLVFGTLTVLFFLLAIGDALENALIKKIAGFEGILCGALAIYTGLAQVLNEVYGRTIMPLGARAAAPKLNAPELTMTSV